MLSDDVMFRAFTERGRHMIGFSSVKRPKVKLILDRLDTLYPNQVQQEIETITNLSDDSIRAIIEKVPSDIMFDWQKDWCLKLIPYRREWLSHWYNGRLKDA